MTQISDQIRRLDRLALAAMLALGLILTQTTRAAAEVTPLAADQVRPLIEGTSVLGTSKSGHPMTWNFRSGGTLDGAIEIEPYDIRRDKGRWWVNSTGRLCYQWNRWASAERRCPGLALEDGKIRLVRRNGSLLKWDWKIMQAGPGANAVLASARSESGSSIRSLQTSSQAQVLANAVRVPQGMLKRLMAGITVTTLSANDSPLRVRFGPNGRLDGELSATFGTVTDEGKWWTTKVGTFCVHWKRFMNGQQRCSILTLSDRSIHRLHPAMGHEVGHIWKIKTEGPQSGSVMASLKGVTGPQMASVAPKSQKEPSAPASSYAQLHFGTYHAVVIGNNRYRHLTKLKSARNDADVVAQTLAEDYGFRVAKLIDATRSDILGTLARMRAKLKPDDNLLIYYAGHGIVDSVTEQGYWLPVDAEKENPANWISNTDITNMLRAIRARHVLVVADSCYSGTLVRAASAKMQTSRDKFAWVKRMLGKRGRTALVSGGLEPVVDTGTGGNHSVFAQAFISTLRENQDVLEGHALFDRIKRPVVLNANQTPQYSDIRLAGHEGGEFVFVRRRMVSR